MRIGGIDPSSTRCGVALAVDEKLETSDVWVRDKRGSAPEGLHDYFIWLMAWLIAFQPDIVVVEFLSVERNAETTRKISHYQAISVLACKLRGITVIEARVSSARKHTLGRGNLSKEDAWKEMKRLHPSHKFQRADSGGYDEMDAGVLALAGPRLTES
jgi:Holliday junction resolvasome RuvABC endonuclease subunit